MKRVIVTGGAGFIGTNLCKKLLSQNTEVIAIDNLITSTGKNTKLFAKNPLYTFIKHDIVNPFPKSVLAKIGKIDEIYHLACPTGVPNLTKLAEEMILTCSAGTRNILELAKNNKARLIFTSSSEVYGDPEVFPQTEEYAGNADPVGIRSPYEEGKRFSESLVRMYVYKYNLDAKIVRIFNTYGTYMSFEDMRVIPRFFAEALNAQPLTVQGKGQQKRTFCYVDDLVDGLMIVLKDGKKGEVYNLGNDKEITIKELADLVIRVTKSKSKVSYTDRPSHDHKRRLPSLKKINSLGWKPTTSLQAGLEKVLQSL